jgi:hypothetical protein
MYGPAKSGHKAAAQIAAPGGPAVRPFAKKKADRRWRSAKSLSRSAVYAAASQPIRSRPELTVTTKEADIVATAFLNCRRALTRASAQTAS